MPLVPRLQESAIDCYKHQLHYSLAATAQALLGLLLSFSTTNIYVKSDPSHACNLSIRCLLTR